MGLPPPRGGRPQPGRASGRRGDPLTPRPACPWAGCPPHPTGCACPRRWRSARPQPGSRLARQGRQGKGGKGLSARRRAGSVRRRAGGSTSRPDSGSARHASCTAALARTARTPPSRRTWGGGLGRNHDSGLRLLRLCSRLLLSGLRVAAAGGTLGGRAGRAQRGGGAGGHRAQHCSRERGRGRAWGGRGRCSQGRWAWARACLALARQGTAPRAAPRCMASWPAAPALISPQRTCPALPCHAQHAGHPPAASVISIARALITPAAATPSATVPATLVRLCGRRGQGRREQGSRRCCKGG